FPEQKKRIDRIVKNTRDLIVPFRNKDIYYPEFNGSYSLKAVLPALIPEMRYDALEVQDGEMASNAYLRMRKSGDSAEIASIRKALLEYCRLDTLAMVKILEKMREMAG
ncbi:MAG: DUF2779 domain-containing protein, partial [Deltaproteobacteria bacterium]|nr:DUF2779 domain-containing protein [Deltaproteobacteria bacterium]